MTAPAMSARNIELRPVALEDAPAMQTEFANWNVISPIGGVPWPYPSDGARSYITRRLQERREIYFWGIFLEEQPDWLIGTIEYRLFDDENENRGFWLAERHWGKGIMTRAVARTQDYVFFDLGKPLIRVRSRCTNLASRTIKEKTGAIRVGRGTLAYHDGMQAEDIWEITPQSWAEAKGKLT